jgi:putative colanic acid biosynthesis UDP-glucose lipid carrier transferase
MLFRYQHLIKYFFFVYDIVFLNITYFVAAWGLKNFDSTHIDRVDLSYPFIINITWFALSYLKSIYNKPYEFVNFTRNAVHVTAYHFCILIISLYFIKNIHLSRLLIGIHYSLFLALLLGSRYLFNFLQSKYEIIQYDKRKVVIVGNGEMSYKAAKHFIHPSSGYEFIGFFDQDGTIRNDLGYPVLGSVKNCVDYSLKHGIHEIYSTILPESNEDLIKLVTDAEEHMIRVKFIPDYKFIFNRNVSFSLYYDVPLISFIEEPLERMDKRLKKRLFDVVFTVFLFIVLFWWLFPLMAVLIKLGSKGPVFFKQERSGRNGAIFTCFKFRSMYVNDDSDIRAAERNDDRITPIGRFMRKTNLDELPQFFNVLKGEMSLVGPRPHMLTHTEEYRRMINRFMVRHLLKPGITGWAQVHGLRGDISGEMMEKRVEYDIWYLENWSFLLDIRIVLKTIVNMMKGEKNAY